MKTLTAIIGTASLAVLLAGAVGCENDRTCACNSYVNAAFEAGDTVAINKRGNNCYNYTRKGSWGVYKGKDANLAIVDFKKISDPGRAIGTERICREHLELYDAPSEEAQNPKNNPQTNNSVQENTVQENNSQTNNPPTRSASLDEKIEVAAGNVSVNAVQPVVAQPAAAVAQPVKVINYERVSINQIVQNREKYDKKEVSVLGIPISCRSDNEYFSVIIDDDNTLLMAYANTNKHWFSVDVCTAIDAAVKKNAKILLEGKYLKDKQLEIENINAVNFKISVSNATFNF